METELISTTTDVSQMTDAGAELLFGGLLLTFLGLLLILVIVQLVSQWKLFTKAGEAGWKSIIPGYTTFVQIQLAFGNTKNWLIIAPICTFLITLMNSGETYGILALISFLLSLVSIYIQFGFIKRFASTGMAVASIFIPFIIYPIVAFSDKYQFTPYSSEEDLL